MIRLKTAVLLGFSLELGGILADASEVDRKSLREFGINIGIGFQLRDDLLDAYADPKKFGKQVGGDILANKKTFLLIQALRKATGKTKTELNHWISSQRFKKKEKVTSVKAIYDKLGIAKNTERKINQYFEKGFKNLEAVKGNADAKAFIQTFTKALIGRQS
jgi:geranylgeranyl diphosphate synthase type II